MTKKRPTREGKGGIQDGILLEKKRILQNQTYCGERVHAGRLHADTSKPNTPLRWAASGPGANFGSILGSRWLPFGSLWLTFGAFFPPMSRKPADFSLPISLLQVAGVPEVRRCRSASTMIFQRFLHSFFNTYF